MDEIGLVNTVEMIANHYSRTTFEGTFEGAWVCLPSLFTKRDAELVSAELTRRFGVPFRCDLSLNEGVFLLGVNQ